MKTKEGYSNNQDEGRMMMMMISKGEERWEVGFHFSSRSVGAGDAAWEMCMTLRPLTFIPFSLQDWELCATCLLATRDLKLCFVCLSPENVYRRSTVHSESVLRDVEH